MATTIPVSDETKERFDEHKTDEFKNWDVFMEHVIESYESGGRADNSDADIEATIKEAMGNITLEATDDVRNAAYEGAREAVEELAR